MLEVAMLLYRLGVGRAAAQSLRSLKKAETFFMTVKKIPVVLRSLIESKSRKTNMKSIKQPNTKKKLF
jgi:hypothetical protein